MLFSVDTTVRGRFSEKRCGPSRRCARNASAALENFVCYPQKTFSTASTRLRHWPRPRTMLMKPPTAKMLFPELGSDMPCCFASREEALSVLCTRHCQVVEGDCHEVCSRKLYSCSRTCCYAKLGANDREELFATERQVCRILQRQPEPYWMHAGLQPSYG